MQKRTLLALILTLGILFCVGCSDQAGAANNNPIASKETNADQAKAKESSVSPEVAKPVMPPEPARRVTLVAVRRSHMPPATPMATAVFDPRAVKLADEVLARPLELAIDLIDREFETKGISNVRDPQ